VVLIVSQISGDKNEEQLIRSAHVFIDRPDMLHLVLKDLNLIYRNEKSADVEANTNLVLDIMERYTHEKGIQATGR